MGEEPQIREKLNFNKILCVQLSYETEKATKIRPPTKTVATTPRTT
ncbi:hypothetical protein NIES22_45760 [Calothrix brevissima NIES-22]|nr:hypothetical protein NIES22_45760 [Calothrix brevissima NIES-22]